MGSIMPEPHGQLAFCGFLILLAGKLVEELPGPGSRAEVVRPLGQRGELSAIRSDAVAHSALHTNCRNRMIVRRDRERFKAPEYVEQHLEGGVRRPSRPFHSDENQGFDGALGLDVEGP